MEPAQEGSLRAMRHQRGTGYLAEVASKLRESTVLTHYSRVSCLVAIVCLKFQAELLTHIACGR